MKQIAFLSDGRINILDPCGAAGSANTHALDCVIADNYRARGRELRLKNDWKQKGTGAMFTGAFRHDMPALDIRLPITGLSRGIDERLIYAINFETGGGIYFKNLSPDEPETPIVANATTQFFELDVNPSGAIVVSTAENTIERHISLLRTDDGDFQAITEGECFDSNPKWSLKDENILYYDSAGIGYDSAGQFAGYGPRSIYRFNIKTGELDEILSDDKFDYLCPFEDTDGNMYFIRRPYRQSKNKMTVVDFLTAPFKLLRAIGGWLDFFSRRYTGESLKTSGANPAKAVPKSPEQIFIENNLIEAEKNLKQNASAGDKNPGYAPRDWELVIKPPGAEDRVLHKSVMSYCIAPNGIIYSNGSYVIWGATAVKVHLATKLTAY